MTYQEKINKLIKAAEECIGTPYLYGGESFKEGGFDCSGLCFHSYNSIGINIGRTTFDQIKKGKAITDKNDLKAGDLIFNGTLNNPYHVFLYVGNGYVIKAKKTGTKISKHNKWNWDGLARRIIMEDNNSNKEENKTNDTYFRVVCGSYKDRENAEQMQKKLKDKGFDSFLVAYKE